MITSIHSYNRLSKDHVTSWDQSGGFTVSHRTVDWWRWLLLLATVAAFIGLIALGVEE